MNTSTQGSATTEESSQVGSEETKVETLTIEELQQQNEELKRIAENRQSEINGLNRKNTDLEKEKKTLNDKLTIEERAKLDEDERKKLEIQELAEEKARIERELIQTKRVRMIDQALSEAGLSVEFSNRIIGNTEEEIKNDVKSLKEFLDKQIVSGTESEVNKRFSGNQPSGGSAAVDNDLNVLYKSALKTGKTAQALAIKRQAAKEGIELK